MIKDKLMELYCRTFLSFDDDVKATLRKGGVMMGLGLILIGVFFGRTNPYMMTVTGFGTGLILFSKMFLQ